MDSPVSVKHRAFSSIEADDKILESVSSEPLVSRPDLDLGCGDRVEKDIENICNKDKKPLFFLEEELIVGLLGSIAVGVVLDSYIAMFIAIGLTLFFRFSRKE